MTLSERYATALYDLASESGRESDVLKDMGGIRETLSLSPELNALLKNPVVHMDKKIKITESLFKQKITDLSLKFLRLIILKKRSASLSEICKAYESVYKKNKNITEVKIQSAVPLDAEERSWIEKKIAGVVPGNLEFRYETVPSLLGGFTVEFNSVRIDQSIHGMLWKLHKNFQSSNLTLN